MKSKPTVALKRKAKFSLGITFLLIFALPAKMLASAPAAMPAVATYDELLSAIREAKAQSRERVETLVEQEKVREAWEIGKLIETHILHNKPRADYDKQVVQRLAKDLESSPTEIWYMLEFARAYPILPQAGELSWAHYRELLSLNDSKEREEIAKRATQQHWGRDRLREEVRRRQAAGRSGEQKAPAEALLTATPGKPGTYRVVKAHYGKDPNQLVLDLGFSNYLSLEEFSSRRWPQEARKGRRGVIAFKEGDIVFKSKDRLKKSKDAGEKDLFTYSASVIGVIDGDTFTAAVELGFGFATVQTLRLRSLDAPEMETADGREAKAFLEKTMPPGSNILIRTHRSDKYDRYLADVFVEGEYVNRKLVDKGLAVPLSE